MPSADELNLARDFHSFSNPHQVRIRHIDLEIDVLFDQRTLAGVAELSLEKLSGDNHPLILDTKDLEIFRVYVSSDGSNYRQARYSLGSVDPILGTPLTIQLPERARRVRIEYLTTQSATALQWLEPSQTAGKKHPFIYTQSQTIHARSWIPLQDTPQVRMTYTARVRTPENLLALMSAENDPGVRPDGIYRFEMNQPIPSYLIALAVGDLRFKPLSNRAGVYAEPPVVEMAAREFSDTEGMLKATETLYGPYRWQRYDLLVLPPSFPLGGMENPRLSFMTPSILAGDKSLISLIAHEMAHSWSGNLVGNATWRDFWLNEGFAVYVERRILEVLYGRRRKEMEGALGYQDLEHAIATLEERDRVMYPDLKGRNPDECFTRIPYEKGALFLEHLEEAFGRDRFDNFLSSYFDHFAFHSITTSDFVSYLKKNLFDKYPELGRSVPIDEWILDTGIPERAPRPAPNVFGEIEAVVDKWLRGRIDASVIQTSSWTTHEWLHFLRYVAAELNKDKMAELDRAFNLTESGNAEIAHLWLLIAIRKSYEPAYAKLGQFLTSTGRRKLLKPLYEEMVKTPEGKERAIAIYSHARHFYHPIVVASIDDLLDTQ